MDSTLQTAPGLPAPIGASIFGEGVNFALFSEHATAVTLCLFTPENTQNPFDQVSLAKTDKVWHILVKGLPKNCLYGYRIDGPRGPGYCFNQTEYLLDPYAHSVNTPHNWGVGDQLYTPLGNVIDHKLFDWEEDVPPKIPMNDLIIYEMHVRGYTQDGSSQVQHRGTFLGMIEKIPHLVELGINAVELMPVFEFNECEYKKVNPVTQAPLYNYWGYSTTNFFSLMQRYGVKHTAEEFKTLVKELHRHHIEVILDVVYNHTGEGNQVGPTFSFKGIDNPNYYYLDSKGHYLNFSGCGNTLRCNHPFGEQMILDSLRYWVSEMHVDGFRVDLASILTRGPDGRPLDHPPLLQAIANDPVLSQVKFIAEPWDAAGLYQLGFFASRHWSEWNDRYRNTIRHFIRGGGESGMFITNLCGSQDIYHTAAPSSSINFITAHDGFTLRDLVSYNHKHNWENGEDNHDGMTQNESWNCGIKGPTSNKMILALRARQMRNLHLALMISRGVPMLNMGDEYGHTKRGNNNTWCQDNELSWFLWDQLEKNNEFFRFYKMAIQFRKQHPVLCKDSFYHTHDIEWHGREPFKPGWGDDDKFVAFVLKDFESGNDLYVAFNASHDFVALVLPECTQADKKWHWVVNTASPSPYDFREKSAFTQLFENKYRLQPHSAIVLTALPAKERAISV